MSKSQPSSFEATVSVLERLLGNADLAREPACNAAVVFAAIIQARAIDRLTAAVEKNTRAIMLVSDDGLSQPDKWKRLAASPFPVKK